MTVGAYGGNIRALMVSEILSVRDAADELLYLGRYRAECHITAARFYSNVHTFVGMTAAGLAAIAGGTAFAGQTTIAGVAAVGSAVLAGFLTIQKPDERTQAHWQAATKYNGLTDDVELYFKFGRRHDLSPLGGHEAHTPSPSLQAIPQTASSEVEALARFRQQCGAIESESFPVPRHLCASAENYISENDEWFPPLRSGSFKEWRERRAEPHSRWRRPRLFHRRATASRRMRAG